MKFSNNKLNKVWIFTLVFIIIGGSSWFLVRKNYKDKQAVAHQAFLADNYRKEQEEKIRIEEQKRLEQETQQLQQIKLEEQKKAEELKLQEEKKKEEEKKKAQVPVPPKKPEPPKGIPVLMYHYVEAEDKNNDLVVPPEKFRDQMKYLKDSGYTTLSMDELHLMLTQNKPIPKKVVAITLDDGYEDNYTYAYPILKEFGFKATIFMITANIDQPRFLKTDQIKELDKNMIQIESHTVNHLQLGTLSHEEQVQQLGNSKADLEKLLGREIKYIAYPNGSFNSDTLRLAPQVNYKMAFSTIRGMGHKSNGMYKVHRIYVGNHHDIEKFKKLLEGIYK